MGKFQIRFFEVRILTISSGGVRALIELEILALIESRIGFGIPIQEFFDLMIGTRCASLLRSQWASARRY